MIKNFSFIVLLVMFSAGISRNAYAFEISTTNLQGEENSIRVHLSQDTWTLVMAWTTYCGECAKQYSMLSELHDAHKKIGLKVLGVSLDDPQNLQLIVDYQRKKKHQFPSIVADHNSFSSAYKTTTGVDFSGTPTYLLFDRQKEFQAYLDGPITRNAIEQFITQEDMNL